MTEEVKLEPCPFAVGDKVEVLADNLPESYREDWRGYVGYITEISYAPAHPGGYNFSVCDTWPPRHNGDSSDGFNLADFRPASSRPLPEDAGYQMAFYELAKLMDIGARAESPGQVWRKEMLPRLIAALATRPDPANTLRRALEEIEAGRWIPTPQAIGEIRGIARNALSQGSGK